jgi:cell division protein FtsB
VAEVKWKIPKHSDLVMTDPCGFGKTMPAEAHTARERIKWLEAENKRLEQTNDRLVERNHDLTRTLKIMMEIKSDK